MAKKKQQAAVDQKQQRQQRRREDPAIKATKKGFVVVKGVVTDQLPSAMFKVQLENGHEILAHLAGKMRMYKIRVLPGDEVQVEMSPYDMQKGRIITRF